MEYVGRIRELNNLLKQNDIDFKTNLNLSKFSSMGIGGEGQVVVFPKTVKEVLLVQNFCEQFDLPLHILSGGSNTIIDSDYIKGVVMIFRENFDKINVCGKRVIAFSGCSIGQLIKNTVKSELTGFEKFVGVPARLGGMIKTNFGAFNSDISENLTKIGVAIGGNVQILTKEQCGFSYRESKLPKNSIILWADFYLDKKSKIELVDSMKKTIEIRHSRQPYSEKSCGCVFKGTTKGSAGKMIDELDFKSFKVGGAEISDVHAGYIINKGGATIKDIKFIIDILKKKVYNKYEVQLIEEINFLQNEDCN